ncbi:hypothetical protein RRF57_007543 [Xylaria bambusicola]|uniref:Uncharacterized protein n=1 Tax=Xylaria bambusicola TaxID=326684 RepID=A0AAN7UVC5_9PEZI
MPYRNQEITDDIESNAAMQQNNDVAGSRGRREQRDRHHFLTDFSASIMVVFDVVFVVTSPPCQQSITLE